MYQYVNSTTFADSFNQLRPDSFTSEGLLVLFEYLEELEESEGKMQELDVTGLFCTYSEKTAEELFQDYGYKFEGSKEWHLGQWRDALSDETPVVLSVYKREEDYSTGYGSKQVLGSLIIMDF